MRLNLLPKQAKACIDPLHRVGGDREDGNKESHHHAGQNAPASQRMKHQGINAVRPSHLFPALPDSRLPQNIPQIGVPGFDHGGGPIVGLFAKSFPPSSGQLARRLGSLPRPGQKLEGFSFRPSLPGLGFAPSFGDLMDGRRQGCGHRPLAFPHLTLPLGQGRP